MAALFCYWSVCLLLINKCYQINPPMIYWCLKMLHRATQWLILLLPENLKTIGPRVCFCFSCASFLPQSGGLETLNCLEVWMSVCTVCLKACNDFPAFRLVHAGIVCSFLWPWEEISGWREKKKLYTLYFPHAAHRNRHWCWCDIASSVFCPCFAFFRKSCAFRHKHGTGDTS